MRIVKLTAVCTGLLAMAGCDYTGDWLFAGGVEGVPGIIHLNDEIDGFDEMYPADITSAADADAAVVYAEVGPTGTTANGGVTFSFEGTGGHVCIWVDPELVFWNQSVAAGRPTPRWSYPDNVFDDGDLDLFAGLAAYYNGSPGETVGDFKVRYEDSLGNPIEIALNECVITSSFVEDGAHSGRGAPEYCTISNTQPGVNYLVLAQTWSTPLDDDRLGFGLLVTNGTCNELRNAVDPDNEECLILGEAIHPEASGSPGPWIGLEEGREWSGSIPFEETYCDASARMSDVCITEASTKDCETEHCFCGDPANTPSSGQY